MATRFVATHECDASDEFKNAYIAEIEINPFFFFISTPTISNMHFDMTFQNLD